MSDTIERIMKGRAPATTQGTRRARAGATHPEEEAERAQWIEEMNAACEEALTGGLDETEDREHPLVTHCHQLSDRLHECHREQ